MSTLLAHTAILLVAFEVILVPFTGNMWSYISPALPTLTGRKFHFSFSTIKLLPGHLRTYQLGREQTTGGVWN